MKPYTAYALAWLATGVAVSVGIYITKEASCLWAMLFPAFISVKTGNDATEVD